MKSLLKIVVLIFMFSMTLWAQQKVYIDQAGVNNEIVIDQLGQNNEADVIQKVDNSISEVEQSGNDNEAYQLNSASSSGYVNNQVVTQTGNSNRSVQIGINGTGYGEQVITQSGNSNYAKQLRRGDFSSAYITQIGQLNQADVNIFSASDNAVAKIVQEGNSNASMINIEGSQALSETAKATIKVQGNHNGRQNDPVRINLVGDNHTAQILQGMYGYIDNNMASINLVGDFSNALTGSKATISQEFGDNNKASITSIGVKNGMGTDKGLEIVQHGSNNLGELAVFGVGLEGKITQLGNNMSVRVVRTN